MSKLLFPAFMCGFFILSCESDDKKDLPPEITDVSVGNHEGSGEVARGDDMHVYFTATSQKGTSLDYYHILIQDHDEYRIIDEDFKDRPNFKGTTEAIVHEHIEVNDTALLGDYHVLITVVDENGKSTNTEALDTHIEVIE